MQGSISKISISVLLIDASPFSKLFSENWKVSVLLLRNIFEYRGAYSTKYSGFIIVEKIW